MSDNDRIIFISIEGLRLDFNVKALTEVTEYFRAMFSGQFEESGQNEIKLKDVSLRSFSLFHEWVHGVRKVFIDLNLDELTELMVFADRFMIDRMKELIYKSIRDRFAWSDLEPDNAYKVLQTGNLIGDLVLKDIYLKWFQKVLAVPTDWSRDIIMDFTARLFRHREFLENSDLTNEAFQEYNLDLKKSHQKSLAFCSDYTSSHYSWNAPAQRIDGNSLYLQSLFKVTREPKIEAKDKISAEEHKLIHEYLYYFRYKFEDQTFAMQVRLMKIAKRFHIIQMVGLLMNDVSNSIFKEKEPSAALYSLVEIYLQNKDSNLESHFSLWVSRKFQASLPMKLYQLLQYTSELQTWNHDMKVNRFALTDQAVNEIDRIFKVNRKSLMYYYDILMNKSTRRELEEGIKHMKQLEKELKDCEENQQEFKEFVTEKRQEYEKKLNSS